MYDVDYSLHSFLIIFLVKLFIYLFVVCTFQTFSMFIVNTHVKWLGV